MYFELTDALIADILFSMEDQGGEFLIDTGEGVIAEASEERLFLGGERFIPLPRWDSADGYRLMEHFTAAFRNPLIRGELTRALNQGKGVFRAFKDALGMYPEVEKRWFIYKEREMKREVLHWYNGLREEWGMARIGAEPEETGDLLLEDFRFREGEAGDASGAEGLHRRFSLEGEDAEAAAPWEGRLPWSFPGDLSLVAETGGGDFAGYAVGIRRGDSFFITALEVKDEYRGLGIGEELVSRFLEAAKDRGASTVTVDLPARAEGFSRVLLRGSFKLYASSYYVSLGGNTLKTAPRQSPE